MSDQINWGILSTARIAQNAFLPAVRAAGDRALVVGGRDLGRTRSFADENQVKNAVEGYDAVLADDGVDAVYIPLPNSLHGEWTIKALQAGKAVLCEKPLCGSVEEARRVIEVARESARPLWEAFVFPYHAQQFRLTELVGTGAIGEVREIQSGFHFHLTNPSNIRLNRELGGGGLNDVGCYPVRFAQLIFGATPIRGTALATTTDNGVDIDLQGVLEFSDNRRLIISCGMTRDTGTFARIIGDDGEIRVTNPFHARDFDTIEIRVGDSESLEHAGSAEPSFTDAIRHFAKAIRQEEAPRHTATEDSLATEVGLELLRSSAKSGRVEAVSS